MAELALAALADAGPRRPVRIANCSGFFGDRLAAAREMVEGGPIDVLTGDWLAELTMLILARQRLRTDPARGYARTFLTPDGAGARHLPGPGHQGRVATRAGSTRPAAPTRVARAGRPARPGAADRATSTATTCCRGCGELRAAAGVDFAQPRHRRAVRRCSACRPLTANAYLGGCGHRRRARRRRRRGRHRAGHRRRARRRPGGVVARLGAATTWDAARRRGGGRPRHRVRRAGHRRQLRVLRRGARARAPRLPDRRGGRRRHRR